MKIKTLELIDITLDWAVANCKGENGVLHDDGITRCIVIAAASGVYKGTWKPSVNWSQGGPIIERERIELCSYSNDGVDTVFTPKANEQGYYSHEEEQVVSVPEVVTWTAWVKYGSYKQDGPTPLIAAMRCYVASKLGNEVEIPEELSS